MTFVLSPPGQHELPLLTPGYLMFFVNIGTDSERQRENGENQRRENQLFFTNKTKTISSQFSPPLTQDPKPTRSTAQTPIFSFCPLTEAEVSKLLLSSHPTTCPLDPIPSHLLQAISSTLLPALTHISTHLSSQASSPLHSSRLE